MEKLKDSKLFKTKAVDTTGAGDIFHGAFVYGLSNSFSIEKNIEPWLLLVFTFCGKIRRKKFYS